MSFLTISTRRMATVARTARPRIGAVSVASPFSTSAARPKTVTEAAKDTLKTVDRVVSDKLVDGINMSESVAGKVKEAGQDVAADVKSGKATTKAKKAGNEAAAKTEQAGNQTAAKAREMKNDAMNTGENTMNKLKEDAKDKVRQAADEVSKRVD